MSEPYLGEIRMFAGNFAPNGWAFCAGQILPISQNDALFALLGTTYGGDGITTFALPDFRGRIPVHVGNGHVIGEVGGAETVALTTDQMPTHSHGLFASSLHADHRSPKSARFAQTEGASYAPQPIGSSPEYLNQISSGADGGSDSHDNLQPFLCVSFIMALEGIFPSRG